MKDKLKEYGKYIGIAAVLILGGIFYFMNQSKDTTGTITDFNTYQEIEEETSYMYIDIKGQVYNPGVYKVESNTRLYQLIYKAGGLTDIADEDAINLSMILMDENVIYIPSFDDNFPALGINKEDPSEIDNNQLININTASKEELMTLPGIGESTANAIIDYRTNNGSFETTENITDVAGIGDATFENIKERITV